MAQEAELNGTVPRHPAEKLPSNGGGGRRISIPSGDQGGGDNGGGERGVERNSIRRQSDKMFFSLASKAEESEKKKEKNKLIRSVFLSIRP